MKGGDKVDKQTKQLSWEVKVVDAENRIIDMIGSTEDYDRVGDRMIMAGLQSANYLKNPVILANHCHGDGAKPSVIGKCLALTVQNSKLVFKIQFAETDNGKEWFYLYSNKYMSASSIGFIPIKYEPNDHRGYDILEWELLELSLVSVPCNPNALQKAFEDGKISKDFYDNFLRDPDGSPSANKSLNNEGEIEDMKIEDVQALIDKAVEAKVKTLNDTHKTELENKQKELDVLKAAQEASAAKNEPAADPEPTTGEKGGATISQSNLTKLGNIAESMNKAAEDLESFISSVSGGKGLDNTGSTDPEDEEKEYTEEEIQKMVADKISTIVEGAGK